MVQMREVPRIRQAWIDKGDPPCDHPRIDKEYDLGGDTGDRVFLDCGQYVEAPRRSQPLDS